METGPNFVQIVQCSRELDKIKASILDVVTSSYHEGFLSSQSINKFYPIYRLGQTWRVRDYVFTLSGKLYDGPLGDILKELEVPDAFLLKPGEQPIVDFERLACDIAQYKQDTKDVSNLRAAAVRGALYIDSRGLKTTLTPIPQRSLLELQEMLSNLAQMKIDRLMKALKFYSKKLKQEP